MVLLPFRSLSMQLPGDKAQQGNTIRGDAYREFCIKKGVTLEDSDSIWLSKTAEASFYLRLDFLQCSCSNKDVFIASTERSDDYSDQ